MVRYFLTTIMLVLPAGIFAQEITEQAYNREATGVWERYAARMDTLSSVFEAYPDKKDSLMALAERVLREAEAENAAVAIRYAAVPAGLQGLFSARLGLPKDTLKAVLGRIPQAMRRSPYGEALALHVDSPQVQQGDEFLDFSARMADGTDFRLSSRKGKRVLLLYGGLGCMGEDGRKALDDLYRRTNREDFEIVVFWPLDSAQELKKMVEKYPSGILQVSDLKGDFTPFKVYYGAQATPTCFFIDEKGIVRMKAVGFDPGMVDALLK